MLEALSANPEVMETLMLRNPLLNQNDGGSNGIMHQQLRNMMPQLAAQMSQPAFRQMLTNPRALQIFV
ncbi:unnamed protein product [Protopolystoma xenopodis]|uniref:STI1 domain-containing protein n=1 Tax=Protopolystoma xenopodis TaxID=117903 RepID=A0A3S5B5X3_9PLAT|nr:unnamed protein product [Protopolystoma xenopodis]